jgi:hypothetical protein
MAAMRLEDGGYLWKQLTQRWPIVAWQFHVLAISFTSTKHPFVKTMQSLTLPSSARSVQERAAHEVFIVCKRN